MHPCIRFYQCFIKENPVHGVKNVAMVIIVRSWADVRITNRAGADSLEASVLQLSLVVHDDLLFLTADMHKEPKNKDEEFQ
jgi:hypothetical protein